jgi:aspartate/methionine/tyrosine aminotransferase
MTPFSSHEMLSAHRNLDVELRKPNALPFVSGWQTKHPFDELYLTQYARTALDSSNLQAYRFLSDMTDLDNKIISFHKTRENVCLNSERLLVTGGASNAILTLSCWIASSGIKTVYVVTPVYQTFFYFLNMFGVEIVVIDFNVLQDNASLIKLPQTKTCLIISDPTWIAGKSLSYDVVDIIRSWQESTGSYVIMDGAFSFTKWRTPNYAESASTLDPELTIRLICPTKAVALHGVRFAYIICPQGQRENFRFPSSNAAGANSAFDRVCALRIMDVMNDPESNSLLCSYIQTLFASIIETNLMGELAAPPECTYFVFAKLSDQFAQMYLTMNNRYFQIPRMDGYCRINLLSPVFETLLN